MGTPAWMQTISRTVASFYYRKEERRILARRIGHWRCGAGSPSFRHTTRSGWGTAPRQWDQLLAVAFAGGVISSALGPYKPGTAMSSKR